jgi:signal peptide peptidase SppA
MIFNAPLMVREDMLEMAVHWANQAMNLNIVNLSVAPQAMWDDDGPVQTASPDERRLAAAQESGVYVLPIHGALVSRSAHLDMCTTMTSYEGIRSQLHAALNDPAVEHIALDIDSPGGSATGMSDLSEEIFTARQIKPVSAIVNFGAYSAAYGLASAASEIVLSASSGVGSIGVIARHMDMSKRYENAGIKITTIYAGARKNDLASDAPLTDEAAQWLQSLVDENYAVFTDLVARNRGITVQSVKDTEAGVFFGAKAIELGLADRIEPPQAAINRIAAEVAAKRKPKPSQRIGARAAAMDIRSRT